MSRAVAVRTRTLLRSWAGRKYVTATTQPLMRVLMLAAPKATPCAFCSAFLGLGTLTFLPLLSVLPLVEAAAAGARLAPGAAWAGAYATVAGAWRMASPASLIRNWNFIRRAGSSARSSNWVRALPRLTSSTL